MSWINTPGFERRPLVFVEDHLYHTSELLQVMAATCPEWLAETTVCVLDRPGPDTNASIHEWIAGYPDVQIIASVESGHPRLHTLTGADTRDVVAFARLLARSIRPGGLLVQDIQLTTLPFVPADRWWESIYVAATMRGLFAERPPLVRFFSNKRGYSATFGRELVEAGFDPRDVMDKSALGDMVMPTVASIVDQRFHGRLRGVLPPAAPRPWRISEHDRKDIDGAFDVVVWTTARGTEIGGRLARDGHADTRAALKNTGHESATWTALATAYLDAQPGLSVVGVGERIGPVGAGRAELTNLAARHLHTLRARLSEPAAIVTSDHAYRFGDGLRVAMANLGGPSTRAEAGRRP